MLSQFQEINYRGVQINRHSVLFGVRYGGGPTLPRKVISSGPSQSELAVEVYPLRLQLVVMPKEDSATIRISKKVEGQLHRPS